MNNTAIPALVAHRGDMENQPENSWRSLEAALKAGACWLEFDVQMCGDGTFILLHDEDLFRTAGLRKSVFDTRHEELSNISVHQAARFKQRFLTTPVATLEDVLQLLSAFTKVRAMIEIKAETLDHFGLVPTMDALLELLQPWPQHVLISFDYQAIEYAQQNSDLETGWVLERYDTPHHQQAVELKPDYLICNHRKLSTSEQPWRGEWNWMLYDICDPEIAMQWAKQGVELIETGDIAQMLKYPQFAGERCRHGL